MNRTDTTLLLIGVLIGMLFGMGIGDWGAIDSGSITNWIIAVGTIALVVITIFTALSWKAQRIPEARRDFINAIVNFDNYIYKFGTEDFISETNKFKEYHRKLLEYAWNVEKAIMYYYQFNKKDKEDIDDAFCEIIKLINEFGNNLSCDENGECIFTMSPNLRKLRLNNTLRFILKKSYLLLKLVVGKDITIEKRNQNEQHS